MFLFLNKSVLAIEYYAFNKKWKLPRAKLAQYLINDKYDAIGGMRLDY